MQTYRVSMEAAQGPERYGADAQGSPLVHKVHRQAVVIAQRHLQQHFVLRLLTSISLVGFEMHYSGTQLTTDEVQQQSKYDTIKISELKPSHCCLPPVLSFYIFFIIHCENNISHCMAIVNNIDLF